MTVTTPLPLLLRRRMTPLARTLFTLALSLNPDENMLFLFSSRHGDYARTYGMLNTLAEENSLSAAEFSLSVHNALCGLLSIALQNRHGHVAISAGRDTFGCALMESALLLQENPTRSILLVHYDAPLPEVYHALCGEDERTLVVAFTIQAPHPGRPRILLDWLPAQASPDCQPSPSPAHDFLSFLQSEGGIGQARGDRMVWRWRS
ncbi:MAG: beta-ketoacyl synthase chain length factor [Magnetococcales bacterium]|nr:beta-ketoacyl synthase chain length factor [Magnetococcales bacterium]